MTAEDLARVVHETGHAVAAVFHGWRLLEIDLDRPGGEVAVVYPPECPPGRWASVLAAGEAAVRCFCPDYDGDPGSAGDRAEAEGIAPGCDWPREVARAWALLADPNTVPRVVRLAHALRKRRRLEGGEAERLILTPGEYTRLSHGRHRMGGEWQRYQGPRGGHGWKNTRTGEVVYADQEPGAGGEGAAGDGSGPEGALAAHAGRVSRIMQARRQAEQDMAVALKNKDRGAYLQAKGVLDEAPHALGRVYDALPGQPLTGELPDSDSEFKYAGGGHWLMRTGRGKAEWVNAAGVRNHYPDGIPGHDPPEQIRASRARREAFTAGAADSFPEDVDAARNLVAVDDYPTGGALEEVAELPDGRWLIAHPDGWREAKKEMRRRMPREDYDDASFSVLGSQEGARDLYAALTTAPVTFQVGRRWNPQVKLINESVGVGWDPRREAYRLYNAARLQEREQSARLSHGDDPPADVRLVGQVAEQIAGLLAEPDSLTPEAVAQEGRLLAMLAPDELARVRELLGPPPAGLAGLADRITQLALGQE